MLKRLIFILFLSVLGADGFAADWRFKTWDTSNGLPDNTVKCMGQDKYGFLWLGTFNGLCRYDGRTFTVFRHDVEDDRSPSFDEIASLACADNGVWVGTSKGLNFYSFADGRFYTCNVGGRKDLYIKDVLIQGNEVVTLGWNGHIYMKNNDLSFRMFNSRERWYAIARFRDNLYWAHAASGLYLLDLKHDRIITSLRYPVKGSSETIYYSANQRLLYVGAGLDGETAVFRIEGQTPRRVSTHAPEHIKAVIDYGRETLFATDGGGLIRLSDGRYTSLLPSNGMLSSDAVFSLLKDRQGNLLVGTYRGGLDVYSPWYDCFQTLTMAGGTLSQNVVTAVYKRDSKLYVGLDGGGLNIYDFRNRSMRVFNMANSGIPGNNLLSITGDRDYVWLGFYKGGLCRYAPESGRFTSFPLPKGEDHLWRIKDDGHGGIWMGGGNLYRFDKAASSYCEIIQLHGAGISGIALDRNTLWVSTSNKGIYQLSLDGRILRHTDVGKTVKGSIRIAFMFIDSRHRIWVCTSGQDMYLADGDRETLKWTLLENELFHQRVVCMEEERPGIYWIGTYNGLFRYDERTGASVQFTKEDDLPAMQFNYNASLIDNDGGLFWGTTGGLVYFDPRRIPSSAGFMPVYFTDLRLTDDKNTLINLYGDGAKEVRLPYNHNFFTIHFSVPDIAGADKIHYAYCLERFDKDWRYVDRPEAEYTDLPPGEYEFRVRATNADGRWNPKVYTLHVVITPPWWNTWWALALWWLLGIMAVYGVVRAWLHDQKIKHVLHIQRIEREADERVNRSKMDFLVNIVHELRTPVFLITAPLEELASSGKRVVQVPLSRIQAVCNSAMRLNKLINRIIDFRKIESGALRLQLKKFDVVAYCKELSVNYAGLCGQKHITFTFSADRPFIRLEADPSKLDSILSNLVSNAFKYTEEGGRIALSVSEKDGYAVFSVKDNGIGIAPEHQKAVFENFYQVNAAESPIPDDGIGLSFVKRLVELHHGTVTLKSKEGEGSEFIVTLPADLQGSVSGDGLLSENKNSSSESGESSPEIKMEPAAEPVAETASSRIVSPVATHSILLVDDDASTIAMLEDYLKDDFTVYRASTGAEGFRQACEYLVDIIITDLMMPQTDGWTFLKALKADPRTAQIPVIVLTGDTSEENKLRLFKNGGVEAYLSKPVSLQYLRERINYALSQAEQKQLNAGSSFRKSGYNKEEQRFLLQCREIIEANLTNARFNVRMLAEALGMSQSALYKRVKDVTGMSIIEFITDYRMFKAVRYFKQGETNIGNVCAKCGFNDPKNFREIFKRKMKMTPREFIKQLS